MQDEKLDAETPGLLLAIQVRKRDAPEISAKGSSESCRGLLCTCAKKTPVTQLRTSVKGDASDVELADLKSSNHRPRGSRGRLRPIHDFHVALPEYQCPRIGNNRNQGARPGNHSAGIERQSKERLTVCRPASSVPARL